MLLFLVIFGLRHHPPTPPLPPVIFLREKHSPRRLSSDRLPVASATAFPLTSGRSSPFPTEVTTGEYEAIAVAFTCNRSSVKSEFNHNSHLFSITTYSRIVEPLFLRLDPPLLVRTPSPPKFASPITSSELALHLRICVVLPFELHHTKKGERWNWGCKCDSPRHLLQSVM